MALQAGRKSPFHQVDSSTVQRFVELCMSTNVPFWYSMPLVANNSGDVYHKTDDSVILPFEEWECTAIDPSKWIQAALAAPFDYSSSYLHFTSSGQCDDRLACFKTGVIDMRKGVDVWMTSLPSKNRYHVRQGLKDDYEVDVIPYDKVLTELNLPYWIDQTAYAHQNDSMHAIGLLLWSVARRASFIRLQRSSFQAIAGFISNGDYLTFACNVRNDDRSNVGQRLIYEAVKHFHQQFDFIDMTSKTVVAGDETYGVYKAKLCNDFIEKRALAVVSGPVDFIPPYYRRDLQEWVSRAKEVENTAKI